MLIVCVSTRKITIGLKGLAVFGRLSKLRDIVGLTDVAVSQNLRYLFGVGYHPTIVFLKGFLGVHRGTGVLTHCHVFFDKFQSIHSGYVTISLEALKSLKVNQKPMCA